jgi:hypothetical protein
MYYSIELHCVLFPLLGKNGHAVEPDLINTCETIKTRFTTPLKFFIGFPTMAW